MLTLIGCRLFDEVNEVRLTDCCYMTYIQNMRCVALTLAYFDKKFNVEKEEEEEQQQQQQQCHEALYDLQLPAGGCR